MHDSSDLPAAGATGEIRSVDAQMVEGEAGDAPGADPEVRPRVFISYSWKQQGWAIELAKRLMQDGVDVVIDVWELVPGHDKYHYMERMVVDKTITHVLMLCDRSYAEKADHRRGGVSDETQIITKEVYSSAQQTKFVPLILEHDDNGEPVKPAYLGSRLHIEFTRSRDDGYETLLRHLYGKPQFPKPQLGTMPSFLDDTRDSAATRSASAVRRDEAVRLLNVGDLTRGTSRIRDVLDIFVSAVESARVFAREDGVHLDELLIARIRDARPERDDAIVVIDQWCRATPEEAVLPFVPDILEQLLALCHVAPVNSHPVNAFDAAGFLTLEFVLHLVALLVKHRKLQALDALRQDSFIVREPNRDRVAGMEAFALWFDEIDDRRRRRLQLNRTSLTADLLKEREHAAVSFRCIQEADLLLFLIARFAGARWYPRTLVYLKPYTEPFDLFLGAKSPRRFGVLRSLLGFGTLEDFAAAFERTFPTADSRCIRLSESMWSAIDLTRLLALAELFPTRFEKTD